MKLDKNIITYYNYGYVRRAKLKHRTRSMARSMPRSMPSMLPGTTVWGLKFACNLQGCIVHCLGPPHRDYPVVFAVAMALLLSVRISTSLLSCLVNNMFTTDLHHGHYIIIRASQSVNQIHHKYPDAACIAYLFQFV